MKVMGRKSLAERLFYGGLDLGKYLGATTIALSLLGCDHVPKPVSVSGDGRYVTYSAKENGEFQPLRESYKRATMVLYDTHRKSIVNTFEINGPPIWPTNTGDTVAYMSAPEEGVFKEGCQNVKSEVAVHSNGKTERIKNAAYPELSADGKYLLFTRGFEPEEGSETESDYVSLILRERSTGKERNLNVAGMVPDFSPDSKNIVYVAFKLGDGETKKEGAYVETLNLLTGAKRVLGEVNYDQDVGMMQSNPRWIDENRIIFSGKAKKGKDSEVSIATKNGGLTQVTDNTLEEFFVERISKGRVSYVGVDSTKEGDDQLAQYIAKQTLMGWEESEITKREIVILKIAGDNAIILRNSPDKIYMTPVSNLEELDESKITNISGQVNMRRKARNLGGAIMDLFEE